MNQAMPIIATVIAVRAAIGLMVCSVVEEVVKNVAKVMDETKINAVPMAKVLWFNFPPHNPCFMCRVRVVLI